MSNMDLLNFVREKVKTLRPYKVDRVDCAIQLHANESPYPPPPELMDRFQTIWNRTRLNRYPDPDSRGLREAISQKVRVPLNHLVVGNGSDELIQLILQIFCDHNDTIIFPAPTFAMYDIIARGLGINPSAFPLDSNWDFEGEAFLEFSRTQKARVVFFSYPNNPTGNCFSESAIRAVLERFEGIVVIDEAYHDFSGRSFIQDLPKHNNLIILRSLSKIGLAGLRVGYAAAHPLVIEQINKVRLPYNSNSISQAFAEHTLKNFSAVQTQIDTILEERSRMAEALSQLKSVTVFPTDSNFILFRAEKGGDHIFQQLVESGILIRDLSSHPRLNHCFRVTVGTPEENDRFLAQLTRLTT